jgi:hypothetical protein
MQIKWWSYRIFNYSSVGLNLVKNMLENQFGTFIPPGVHTRHCENLKFHFHISCILNFFFACTCVWADLPSINARWRHETCVVLNLTSLLCGDILGQQIAIVYQMIVLGSYMWILFFSAVDVFYLKIMVWIFEFICANYCILEEFCVVRFIVLFIILLMWCYCMKAS